MEHEEEIQTEFPGLTPAELERLACLAEECGEVVQIVGKILRHGYESSNPFDIDCRTNRSLLEKEVGDIQVALARLFLAKDINEELVHGYSLLKTKTSAKYLHHQ